MSTTQRSVVLGVSGGIAAYKVAQLLRLFTEGGFDVRVVPTHAALEFVGKATWEALSGHPIASDVWTDAHDVPHVMVGREADLVFVAPATADLMARAAHGLANDLLTNVLLTATCPIVLAPAMHTEMWDNSATQANVATLRSRGVVVLDPDEGRLTGADSGKGRLPEPQALFDAALATLQGNPTDLAGKRVVVSAGGTREHVDPVRFLGNRSSGRQGFAVAAAAARRGAEVTLIAANVSLPTPAGVKRVDVVSAQELHDEAMQYSVGADFVVMVAAVADFRPVVTTDVKIKKSGTPDPIALELTTDVLSALVEYRTGEQVIIGFAAETGDADTSVLECGRQKLAAKGCDVLVVNDVGPDGAFESATNEVYILDAEGGQVHVPRADKALIAEALWDAIAGRS